MGSVLEQMQIFSKMKYFTSKMLKTCFTNKNYFFEQSCDGVYFMIYKNRIQENLLTFKQNADDKQA